MEILAWQRKEGKSISGQICVTSFMDGPLVCLRLCLFHILSVCLSISIYLSIVQYVYLPSSLFVCLPACTPVLFVCPFIHSSVCLLSVVHLFFWLLLFYFFLSLYKLASLFIFMFFVFFFSFRPSVCLSVSLSIVLSISLFIQVCLCMGDTKSTPC